jgi:DNA-binding SARP family transcriptional activator
LDNDRIDLAPPGLEYLLLGPLEVRLGTRPLRLGGHLQRSLLALLLMRAGQVVSSDELIDLLWGERAPDGARKTLQVHMSQLRKALRERGGPDPIATRPPGYVLSAAPGAIDVERFQQLAHEGRTQLATGDAVGARDRLAEALGLWRGRALAEFVYEPWAETESERLEEQRLAALEDRLDAELGLGRDADLVGELESLVAAHPLRERLRGQLMLALYRAGRQAEALTAYQEARRALVEELGIEPSPSLVELERSILRQDAELAAPEAPAATASEEPARPAGLPQTRKTVSVLCCELTGLETLEAELDPEALGAITSRCAAAVSTVLADHGASVERFLGDALMGLFGVPNVHEDDHLRAVHAALAARVAVAAVSRELSLPDSAALDVRAAVESGEVIAGRQGGQVAGAAVGAATRLVHEAAPGELLLGAGARRLLGDAAATKRAATSGPQAWQLVSLREAGEDDGPSAPFVDREHDLALLRETFSRMLRESRPQLVAVVGEPGIGKSRLVSEFQRMVSETSEATWYQGRCLPYGNGITYWALREIAKAHTGVLESDGKAAARRKVEDSLAALIDDPAERGWLAERLAPLIGIDETGSVVEREELFAAWQRFLFAIAAKRPLVLLIEDAHWANNSMLAFLEHLAGSPGPDPIQVICTARPELFENAAWGRGARNSTTISLSPLGPADTDDVIRSHVPSGVSTAQFEALRERAGGNPLFAEQLALMLREQPDPGVDVPLPETLQAVIAGRLDTLEPRLKETLLDAAVAGKTFWASAVAQISERSEAEVLDDLRRLSRHDLVQPIRSGRGDEFCFVHLLVRDVAYGQIPRALRGQRHEAFVEWIEQIAGERMADRAEIAAHHLEQALELAEAAGRREDAQRLAPAAARFWRLAGDRAIRLAASGAAVHYGRALELTPPGSAEHRELLVRRGEAASQVGDLPEAQRCFEEALAEAQEHDDGPLQGLALTALSNSLWYRGDAVGSRQRLQEAIAALEGRPPGRELAMAYAEAAGDAVVSLRSKEALDWVERTLALTTQLEEAEEIEVRVLGYRGNARCDLGDLAGRADLRASLDRSLELGLGRQGAASMSHVMHWTWITEGPIAGIAIGREGIEFAERRGLATMAMYIRANVLAMLFESGEWDELLRLADEGVTWDARHGGDYIAPQVLPWVARVTALRGDVTGARQVADSFLSRARAIDEPPAVACAIAIGAELAEAAGEQAEAVELALELRDLGEHRSASFRCQYLPEAVRVLAWAGEATTAQAMLVPERSLRAARPRACATAARATLTAAAGDADGAGRLFRRAAELWGEFGYLLEQARAQAAVAACLDALGERKQARLVLDEARRTAEPLGETVWESAALERSPVRD